MIINKLSKNSISKYTLFLIVVMCLITVDGFAQVGKQDLGDLSQNIRGSSGGILTLFFGMSVVAGLCFAVASAFKFKHHKDSPTQVTVGQPISLLMLGAAMIWLPFIIRSIGVTITGEKDITKLEEQMSTSDELQKKQKTGLGGKLLNR